MTLRERCKAHRDRPETNGTGKWICRDTIGMIDALQSLVEKWSIRDTQKNPPWNEAAASCAAELRAVLEKEYATHVVWYNR